MIDISTYIESGILELYVLGNLTEYEIVEVQLLAATHPLIAQEIFDIEQSLEKYALSQPLQPDVMVKPTIFSTIDFIDRITKGEPASFPPLLHEGSKISDYAEWLNRDDMQFPDDFVDFHGKIIAHNEIASTLIVWLKDGTPAETHTNELERFLIIEGTCTIIIDKDEFCLKAGDVMSIPLYKSHFVKVTSLFPCKVILQRAAA